MLRAAKEDVGLRVSGGSEEWLCRGKRESNEWLRRQGRTGCIGREESRDQDKNAKKSMRKEREKNARTADNCSMGVARVREGRE